MLEFIWKLIELFVNRKNKFQKTKEALDRRLSFFEDVKKLDNNTQLNKDEKRAIKNSLAQTVCGSRLVDYELVDYYHRNKKFKNFEIIAPIVAFWDEAISKEYDENDKIKSIKINFEKYRKERRHIITSLCLMIFFDLLLFMKHINITTFFIKNFHVNLMVSEFIYVVFYLFLLFFTFLAFYGMMTVLDLDRYTEDEFEIL